MLLAPQEKRVRKFNLQHSEAQPYCICTHLSLYFWKEVLLAPQEKRVSKFYFVPFSLIKIKYYYQKITKDFRMGRNILNIKSLTSQKKKIFLPPPQNPESGPNEKKSGHASESIIIIIFTIVFYLV